MALDTRDRRASALGGGLSWLAAYPSPDGSIDSENDRRQVLGLYRVEANAALTVDPDNLFIGRARGRLWIP